MELLNFRLCLAFGFLMTLASFGLTDELLRSALLMNCSAAENLANPAGTATFAVAPGSLNMPGSIEPTSDRSKMWIDLCSGEPTSYERVLDDLATTDVIYLGERHGIGRHHNLQARIVGDLAEREIPLVLGMEMMEKHYQPVLDRYASGEIDFDQLAEETNWKKRWNNFQDYKEALEAAKKAGIPILALNARMETIRKVARSGGLKKLDKATRKELPENIQLDDPKYKQLIAPMMMGHMTANPDHLKPMFDAQICRDETMAENLCNFLKTDEGKGRKAIVLCGSIHASHGLGTPARVRRRMPDLTERIIIFSGSGDMKVCPTHMAKRRPVNIKREKIRKLNLRMADYLHVTTPKKMKHPKIVL